MLSTELGCIPILSDNTTNLVKAVGKVLGGYEVSGGIHEFIREWNV